MDEYLKKWKALTTPIKMASIFAVIVIIGVIVNLVQG